MFERISNFVNGFFGKSENTQSETPTFSLSKLNDFQNFNLTVDSPIEDHAEWIYNNVLFKGREPGSDSDEEVTLRFHGMQHASRVSVYTRSIENIRQKHEQSDALTQKDKKLLEITGLLHDAARTADGPDMAEHESGSLTYAYLKKLNVEEPKAISFAEAIVNKDPKEDGYHKLTNNNGILRWHKTAPSKKNAIEEILHDADSLDHMRVDPEFEKEKLDLLQKPYSESAKKDVDDLISDVGRLIRKQDDSAEVFYSDLRKKYEQPKGYQNVVQDINEEFPALKATYQGNKEKSSPTYQGFSPLNFGYFRSLAAKGNGNETQSTLDDSKFFAKETNPIQEMFLIVWTLPPLIRLRYEPE